MKQIKIIFFLFLSSSLFLIYAKTIDSKDGEIIVNVAIKLIGETKLIGENISDCSHTVHKIYHDASFEYDFVDTAHFASSKYFVKVDKPQLGDVVLFDTRHVGIYSNDDEIIHWSIAINNNPEQIKRDSIKAVKNNNEKITYYRFIVKEKNNSN